MHDGNEKAATDHLRLALRFDPANRLAHLDLGVVLSSGSESAEAIRHLREAIRLDPSNPDAHYRLGRILASQGRDQEAEAEFAKVRELANKETPAPPLIRMPGRKDDLQP
jgi:Flp pilus assembly protein TadD